MDKIIFGRPKVKFGNVWAFTSRMILHGINNNLDTVYLSSESKRVDKIVEMWDCFDNKNIKLKIVDEKYTTNKKYGVPEHKEEYVQTKTRWKENISWCWYRY